MTTLHLTEEQLRLVQTALDFYSRVGIGQFDVIKDHPTFTNQLRNEFKDENGNLKMTKEFEELIYGDPKINWKLVRERDGLTKQSNDVMWIEFNEEGRFKDKYDTPAVGRSLIMSPFSQYFTWQTTIVTEIVEERDDYVKFKTENSNYELWKLNAND